MGAKEAKCWTGENWTRGGVGEGGGGVTGPDTVVRVVLTAGEGDAGNAVKGERAALAGAGRECDLTWTGAGLEEKNIGSGAGDKAGIRGACGFLLTVS